MKHSISIYDVCYKIYKPTKKYTTINDAKLFCEKKGLTISDYPTMYKIFILSFLSYTFEPKRKFFTFKNRIGHSKYKIHNRENYQIYFP